MVAIDDWGVVALDTLNNYFSYNDKLKYVIAPNFISSVDIDADACFANDTVGGNLITNTGLSDWNTPQITNMKSMFANNSVFNDDISGWNTSNVTNVVQMFALASKFNQPINWTVSSNMKSC